MASTTAPYTESSPVFLIFGQALSACHSDLHRKLYMLNYAGTWKSIAGVAADTV